MQRFTQPDPTPPVGHSPTVTGLAWLFITLSLGTILMLSTTALTTYAGAASPVEAFAGRGAPHPLADWLLARHALVTILLLSGSLVTLWLAFALLRRRPWARHAFIAMMAGGFMVTLFSVALTPLVFALELSGTDPESVGGIVYVLGLLIVTGTGLAALFAWVGWMLTRPPIRDEFRRRLTDEQCR